MRFATYLLIAASSLVLGCCGPEKTHPSVKEAAYCGSSHPSLPSGIMSDQQWECIEKEEPVSVIKALYPGVQNTDEGLLWKSGDGRRVYIATTDCPKNWNGDGCPLVVKNKKVYTR